MEEFSIATMEESSSSKVTPLLSNNIDDTNIVQRLSSVLLNEFNYLPWSIVVTIALGGRSKLRFINGSISSPDVSRIWNMVIQRLVGDVLDS